MLLFSVITKRLFSPKSRTLYTVFHKPTSYWILNHISCLQPAIKYLQRHFPRVNKPQQEKVLFQDSQ